MLKLILIINKLGLIFDKLSHFTLWIASSFNALALNQGTLRDSLLNRPNLSNTERNLKIFKYFREKVSVSHSMITFPLDDGFVDMLKHKTWEIQGSKIHNITITNKSAAVVEVLFSVRGRRTLLMKEKTN